MKSMLYNLFIMSEPVERRSNRSRKPIVHYDELIAQSSSSSKPSRALKAPAKATKSTKPSTNPATQPTTQASTKLPIKPSANASKPSVNAPKPSAKSSANAPKPSANAPALDPIAELCSWTEALDIKAKKKAKQKEITRLTKLGLRGVMEEVKPLKDVQFEPLVLGDHREPQVVNIPSTVDRADPLALFDLFIPPRIYATIAENTNLYAITKNAPTSRSATSSRFWTPTTDNEIRVLFGILFYIGVHKEPNYKIYWESPKHNGPIHALNKHMSLNRYENLRRYLHMSPPMPIDTQKSTESQEPSRPFMESQSSQPLQASLENSEDPRHWW
jgi:hypothetical protein